MTTRRPTTRRAPGRGLQVVGPDGLPPATHEHDADPVDRPGSHPGPDGGPGADDGAGSGADRRADDGADRRADDGADRRADDGAVHDPSPPGPSPVGPSPGGHLPAPPPAAPAALAVGAATVRPRITVPARPGARTRTGTSLPARAPSPAGPGALAAAARRDRARADGFLPEDPLLADMRARSQERDIVPAAVGTSATLSFLAAALRAASVVEIGTGLGVGTVSLLRGMPRDGLLTSIDLEPEYQRLARLGCVAAGFAPSRVRMIAGSALDVLPRLSDRGYDLVVVDAEPREYPRYLDDAVRLLRTGGVVVLVGMLGEEWAGSEGAGGGARRPADAATAADLTAALRETARGVREDERLVPVMLPVSEGLLCAAVR